LRKNHLSSKKKKNTCTIKAPDGEHFLCNNSLLSHPLTGHALMVDPWWQPMAPAHLQEPATDWRSRSTGGT